MPLSLETTPRYEIKDRALKASVLVGLFGMVAAAGVASYSLGYRDGERLAPTTELSFNKPTQELPLGPEEFERIVDRAKGEVLSQIEIVTRPDNGDRFSNFPPIDGKLHLGQNTTVELDGSSPDLFNRQTTSRSIIVGTEGLAEGGSKVSAVLRDEKFCYYQESDGNFDEAYGCPSENLVEETTMIFRNPDTVISDDPTASEVQLFIMDEKTTITAIGNHSITNSGWYETLAEFKDGSVVMSVPGSTLEQLEQLADH